MFTDFANIVSRLLSGNYWLIPVNYLSYAENYGVNLLRSAETSGVPLIAQKNFGYVFFFIAGVNNITSKATFRTNVPYATHVPSLRLYSGQIMIKFFSRMIVK